MTFKPIKYRAHNAYDTEAASDEAAITITEPSLTIQSMTDDADLNVMMKRFGVTGKFPENTRIPTYGDYTQITDFRSALEVLANAEETFQKYPADFRARFQNNPQLFLEYCDNPANREEMQRIGLLNPPAPATAGPGGTGGPPGPNVPSTPPGAPGATAS